MRYIDHESDNNGLVSENLIRLTPEEEDSGVFRYVSMNLKQLMPYPRKRACYGSIANKIFILISVHLQWDALQSQLIVKQLHGLNGQVVQNLVELDGLRYDSFNCFFIFIQITFYIFRVLCNSYYINAYPDLFSIAKPSNFG